MGKPNFSDEFKRDAVAQITERGYPVAEVSQRLGVSQHSLYAWKRQLGRQVSGDASKDADIRQLKRELARVTEERDILKNGRAFGLPVRGRNGSWYVADGGSRPIAYW
ncbi:transposase [Novosphingobium capsulatum]|uniref:Transposase n=1 Tax=Novosphingobium capsulatum TaxID=13688 RepID=A0ABU1MS84_9SPHN|nr:transposase [Novosphingobium sp. BK592]MDR6513094.1 transposase [Novosphingobium capsulatum]